MSFTVSTAESADTVMLSLCSHFDGDGHNTFHNTFHDSPGVDGDERRGGGGRGPVQGPAEYFEAYSVDDRCCLGFRVRCVSVCVSGVTERLSACAVRGVRVVR